MCGRDGLTLGSTPLRATGIHVTTTYGLRDNVVGQFPAG